MSSRLRAIATERSPSPAFVVAAAGCVVLLARPFVSLTPDARVLLFAAVYLAVATASLVVPVASERPRAAPSTVFFIGIGSIVLASTIVGRPAPAPYASLALPLALLAAVAEEALLRRVAYARLARLGAIVAIAGSAILFALVHLPAYGLAAMPVDIGAGILFGWQRWASGTWLVPAGTHAFANALAILR